MISEGLKQRALQWLQSVISDSTESGVAEGKTIGYESGYTIGYNKGNAEGAAQGEINGYNRGASEGYAKGYDSGKEDGIKEGKAIGYESGYKEGYEQGVIDHQTPITPDPITPDPVEPEPIEPEPIEPSTGSTEYDSEKAKANLKALLTDSYVFAIMDKYGNAYKTVEDWKNHGSNEVLGIGYCTSKRFMCMSIKRIASSVFGGNGIKFNSKVYTTTKQWHNTSTAEIAAFDDYTGVSNTEGIMEGCSDSLAEKCHNVVFANGKNGYMPACAELRTYCKYFSQVDKLLEGVGGDKLKTINGAQAMHSSTCKDKSYVWAVRYYRDGDAQPQANLKTQKWATRAFVEL